jgi:hypothetical protein
MDAAYITSYDRVKPDAAVIADLHLSHYCSVRCDKTILAKAGGFALYR